MPVSSSSLPWHEDSVVLPVEGERHGGSQRREHRTSQQNEGRNPRRFGREGNRGQEGRDRRRSARRQAAAHQERRGAAGKEIAGGSFSAAAASNRPDVVEGGRRGS